MPIQVKKSFNPIFLDQIRPNNEKQTYIAPMEIKKEIWKDIPGFEGSYKASNFGTIKSLPRITYREQNGRRIPIRKEGKVMTPKHWKQRVSCNSSKEG